MNVAVLGCGPAGLMAAHAASQEGATVTIYSIRAKSIISGAQYMHDPIPGLTDETPDGYVTYLKHGTRAGYAEKVYGSRDAPCSWDSFDHGQVPAWRMEYAYNLLWERWESAIVGETIIGDDIDSLIYTHDLVISSVPKPSLCMKGSQHSFTHKDIWIADYNSIPLGLDDNVILYNGDPLDHWYRASNLWGHEATESTTPMTGARKGIKPLTNDCTCHDGKIARVGRFGRWEKGVLVHHAYKNAIEACRALQQV